MQSHGAAAIQYICCVEVSESTGGLEFMALDVSRPGVMFACAKLGVGMELKVWGVLSARVGFRTPWQRS